MNEKQLPEEKYELFGTTLTLKKLTLAGRIIFFFDVFLALIIITGASILIQTEFGKVSLIFGFVMLALTIFLKIIKKW